MGGNVDHIAQHGLTPADFEFVFQNYEAETVSESSGRPMRFGRTVDGRLIAVVFEWIEAEMTVYPVTAFEVRERL
ncbi:MAG: hypothetical protein RLZZ232_2112 [Planctomycetota bacterium]